MSRKFVYPLVFAVILAFGTATHCNAAGVYKAVIVGINNYKTVNDLKYSKQDALDIQKLVLEYGVPTGNARLLTETYATKSAIKSALSSWKSYAGPGKVFLFFFSGHGTYGTDLDPVDETGGTDEYICPYDSVGSNLSTMIRDDELRSWLQPTVDKGAQVLVILDTCFSGGFVKKTVTIGGVEKEAGVKTLEGKAVRSKASKAGGTSFAKDLNLPGYIVMTASDDDEYSYEYGWFQNGVFTYLLKFALSGQADDSWLVGGVGDDSGDISTNELYYGALAFSNKIWPWDILAKFNQTPQQYGVGDSWTLFKLK
ncbi:MAG: caspase family protein [Desulfobacteraceae bacterium]|nr:caspase family protein [Desulfobacteraceae bacterium]